MIHNAFLNKTCTKSPGWVFSRFMAPLLPMVMLFTGCSEDKPRDVIMGQSYKPSNVHAASSRLSDSVKRVAFLPIATESQQATSVQACKTLEPMVFSELSKTKRFEVVSVPPARLKELTGQTVFKAEDAFPKGFFDIVREHFGCDAVLFCNLTSYKAYTPQLVGWRMKLVDTRTPETVHWAIDEIFDAGIPAVANAARRYRQSNQQLNSALDESHTILVSPQLFSQYTLDAVFSTLPSR